MSWNWRDLVALTCFVLLCGPLDELMQRIRSSWRSSAQRWRSFRAISSETSRTQPSERLKPTTRTGLLYWPSNKSLMTASRSVFNVCLAPGRVVLRKVHGAALPLGPASEGAGAPRPRMLGLCS